MSANPDLSTKLRVKPWVLPTPTSLLLKNGTVIQPNMASLVHNADVLINNGVVASIAPTGTTHNNNPDVRVVDLQGKYFICPGLIDCHVHVTAVPGVKTMGEAMNTDEQLVALRSTYVLREMLSRGFTTVRDTGGANAALAQAVDEWLIPGPRIVHCGKALSQTGGHGDFRSVSEPIHNCCGGHQRGLGITCDGVPAVLTAVRDQIRKGAKFIKVMCGGGVASFTDALESVQFTAEEVQAITTTCKQMGNIPVTAHAYSVPAIRHAILNGITSIEHGNFLDRETARLMAQKNIFLVPTLSCYGIMIRPPFEDFLPEECKIKNKEVMDKGLEAIQIAEEEGVTVCYGTDLLVSMHALQTEEFSIRAKALKSPQILKHATTNAARLLNMSGKIGEITNGSIGDIIILDADPLEDITVLDRPDQHLFAVIKEGRVFRSRLEGLDVDVEY